MFVGDYALLKRPVSPILQFPLVQYWSHAVNRYWDSNHPKQCGLRFPSHLLCTQRCMQHATWKQAELAWNWPKHLVQSDLYIARRQRISCFSMFQRHILNSFCRGLGRSWVLWLASLAWNLPCPCCAPDVLPSVSRTCKQCSAELCARNCVVNAAWRELLEYIGVLESTRDTLKILWSYSENVQAFERFRARAQSVRLQSSTVIARWQADEWSVPWQRSHCSRAVWPGCRDMWWQIGPTTARIIPNIYIVYIYKSIKMYMYIINNKYVY
jgi:hypothetical protein